MKQKQRGNGKRQVAKSVLRVPDFEVAKSAVLTVCLARCATRLSPRYDEFMDWYCSEPRLSFRKTIVVRYRTERYSMTR